MTREIYRPKYINFLDQLTDKKIESVLLVEVDELKIKFSDKTEITFFSRKDGFEWNFPTGIINET